MRALGARYLDFVTGHPRLAVLAALAILVPLGAGLVQPGLEMEVDEKLFLMEGDRTLETYNRVPTLFGDDKYLMVTVTTPDAKRSVFDRSTFELVDQISRFLDDHQLVIQVRSLTTYQRIVPSDDLVRIVDIWPLEPPYDTFASLERDLMRDELVAGSLVTRDGRTAIISAQIERVGADVTPWEELTRDLEKFVADLDTRGHAIHLAGEPIFNSWLKRTSEKDFARSAPLMVLAIFLPLILIFRRWVGVVLPAAVIVGSTVATMGFLAHAGMKLNIINFMLPVILLPLGIADCVHLLSEFFRHYRRDQGNAKQAAREATADVFWPVVFTTVTTAAGFLSLVTSRLKPVREVGIQAGFGLTLLLIVTLLVVPAVLSRYRGREWRPHASDRGVMNRMSRAVPAFCYRRRWHIILVSLVLSIACVPLVTRLQADSDHKTYFKESSPERRNLEGVDRLLGGTLPLEIIIDTGRPDGVKDPALLRSLRELSEWLAASGMGAPPRTVVDYLEALNEQLTLHRDERDPARGYHTLPPESDMIAQLLLVYDSLGPRDALSSMIDPTGQYVRLTFLLPMQRTGRYQEVIDRVERRLAEHHPELKATLTGRSVLLTALDSYIITTTNSSFAVGLGIVLLLILAVLRSVRLWLLSILPNVLPLFIVGGTLAALDIPLDMATTMIASITCGLIVDDTIHFMTRLRHHMARGAGPLDTVAACYREVGTALLLTSVVLAIGFSVYLFGSFIPNIRFGFLSCIIILLALVADLILVPALLFVAWPSRGKDRLGSLPDAPARGQKRSS